MTAMSSVQKGIEASAALEQAICHHIASRFIAHRGLSCEVKVAFDGQFRNRGTQYQRFKITWENRETYYRHYLPEVKKVLKGDMLYSKMYINPKYLD